MNFHYETHLNLQSNSDMYMWNQVNYNHSHYTNVGTSAPYNHCSYPKVPCPHQKGDKISVEVAMQAPPTAIVKQLDDEAPD
jgi:hypothetical protein